MTCLPLNFDWLDEVGNLSKDLGIFHVFSFCFMVDGYKLIIRLFVPYF
jgi:hypothetical protein